MKDEKQIDPYYQKEAKQVIDSMFDSKVFNEKITRDDMQGFEDFIAFLFQSHIDMARKGWEFSQKIKHLN